MHLAFIDTVTTIAPALEDLLIDTVEAGASIGFHAPLARAEAHAYWQAVEQDLTAGTKRLLVAQEGNDILGTVQLALEPRANGRHRAEVQKLMVAPKARGRGIARALMAALEDAAAEAGRTLLVLDTRRGDVADGLYARIGYTRAGIIPGYAIDMDGSRSDTCLFYKTLPSNPDKRTAP